MVIFNGKNSKILMKKLNNLTIWILGTAFILTGIIFFMLNMNMDTLATVTFIENAVISKVF